jgi:DEAD/DEAH box helicase domain-containing protein
MPNSKIRPSFWEHHHCVPLSCDLAPSSIFERHRDYVCFDLETKDLAPPGGDIEALKRLGASVVCAYDSREGKILTFFEDEIPHFNKILSNRLIVGYNIRRFDLPVLAGYGLKLEGLDVFDLMDEVERGLGRRFIKLEYVAQGTLGEGKSGEGVQAVEWFKEGKFKELAEYCARDVEVTHRVFRHGLEKNFLSVKFPEKDAQSFRVEWT